MKTPRGAPPALKKTSIKLPEGLWKRFRIRSLEEDRDASAILANLIEQYLERRRGGGQR